MTLRGVQFDVAGTLFDQSPSLTQLVIDWSAEQGWAVPADAFAVFVRTSRAWPIDTGDVQIRVDRWATFCALLICEAARLAGQETAETDPVVVSGSRKLAETVLDPGQYVLFPEALEVINALASRSIPMGIISNFDVWLREILAATGLEQLFECIVISSEFGVRKPDPRIFVEAAQRLGVPLNELLMVGDSPRADIEGALGAGMEAVLIDREGLFENHYGWRITDLREILTAFEG